MFDWYAFADYSGAREASAQRKAIAWAVDRGEGKGISVAQGLTRHGLLHEAVGLLQEAESKGKRVLFGFDHNYGFPAGFYEALWGAEPDSWEQITGAYCGSVEQFAGERTDRIARGNSRGRLAGENDHDRIAGENDRSRILRLEQWSLRAWAKAANEQIARGLGVAAGPFWGSRFGPKPDGGLFRGFALADGRPFFLHDRRLVEMRYRRLKPGYQVGGIGSVGQQTLYGILYLRELLKLCREAGIAVHVWPQHGAQIPAAGGHVAVEVYPTLSLALEGIRGPRTDAGDAAACVSWLSRLDREGELAQLLALPFGEEEWQRARLEGWVLGVKPNQV
ncbi:hypothetical protein [Paenibacillus sp. YN15]|uniref:hypothetical protein n=1 Tax=Paenibacillus sp. YN15 TaxID=1742774 RepID=UPI000DCD2013|nr:hypothetical protein [Paenibacillus sp. YN15]RAU97162.1 hypothetical protein DQG13_19555 [Paenibacillus sp. YN15]